MDSYSEFPTPEYAPPTQPQPAYYPPEPKTSGLAIASLVCSILGLLSCCLFVPSVLGVVFGAVALPPINRGEARGRGLGIAGLILGGLGLLVGAVAWVALIKSPDVAPIPGTDVSQADRRTLEKIGAIQSGEHIELLSASGFFSVKEGGVVITDQRIVVFSGTGGAQSAALADVAAIDYTAATSWLDEGVFVLVLDNGKTLHFQVDGQSSGDKTFHRILQQSVTTARKASHRPAPLSSMPAGSQDEAESSGS